MYIYVVVLITGARGFRLKHFCKITRECVEIGIDRIINLLTILLLLLLYLQIFHLVAKMDGKSKRKSCNDRL